MENTTHTPLPWLVEYDGETPWINSETTGSAVAHVLMGDDSPFASEPEKADLIEQLDIEGRANAELIVTAVNYHSRLVEAVRFNIRTLDSLAKFFSDNKHEVHQLDDALNAARDNRAILAELEGKA